MELQLRAGGQGLLLLQDEPSETFVFQAPDFPLFISFWSLLPSVPPGCHPFSPATPSPRLPSQHTAFLLHGIWLFCSNWGRWRTWQPPPLQITSALSFSLCLEKQTLLLLLVIVSFGLPHGNRISNIPMFPPPENVSWFLRSSALEKLSFCVGLCNCALSALSCLSSVFSRSRQRYFQHLPGWWAACREIQLPSLLGPNARPRPVHAGRVPAAEAGLAGLFSHRCCRQHPVLEPASPSQTGASQTERGSALGELQGRWLLYQVFYILWMPFFAPSMCWERQENTWQCSPHINLTFAFIFHGSVFCIQLDKCEDHTRVVPVNYGWDFSLMRLLLGEMVFVP